jgi:tRNA-splicing endonuclease subunit Sen15
VLGPPAQFASPQLTNEENHKLLETLIAMAPQTSCSLPQSSLGELLSIDKTVSDTTHPPHLRQLASAILYNLQHEHDWTLLSTHTHSPSTGLPLPRPLVSGLPPKRIYVHPDEQVEILRAERKIGNHIMQYAEREWVLPTHLAERWSLHKFAELFDAIQVVPPGENALGEELDCEQVGQKWKGRQRQKRVLLATLHGDSTVVYYIMHDGIVKPRQN